MREDGCEGVKLSTFCKKVPKCEIKTNSGEEADLSYYDGKTTHEGQSAWLQVLRSTQGTLAIDDFSHGLGWPANAMFFYNRIRERQFFTLPVVNNNKIVRNMSDGEEGKSG